MKAKLINLTLLPLILTIAGCLSDISNGLEKGAAAIDRQIPKTVNIYCNEYPAEYRLDKLFGYTVKTDTRLGGRVLSIVPSRDQKKIKVIVVSYTTQTQFIKVDAAWDKPSKEGIESWGPPTPWENGFPLLLDDELKFSLYKPNDEARTCEITLTRIFDETNRRDHHHYEPDFDD